MTHIIPCDALAVGANTFRARCGLLVRGDEQSRSGDPSCPECKRLDDEDAASILSLSQTTAHDFGGPPEKYREFSPTAGYRRRR